MQDDTLEKMMAHADRMQRFSDLKYDEKPPVTYYAVKCDSSLGVCFEQKTRSKRYLVVTVVAKYHRGDSYQQSLEESVVVRAPDGRVVGTFRMPSHGHGHRLGDERVAEIFKEYYGIRRQRIHRKKPMKVKKGGIASRVVRAMGG